MIDSWKWPSYLPWTRSWKIDYEPVRGRDQHNRPRRNDDNYCHGGKDVKISACIFGWRINRDAYLELERRMEHIFEYYNYSDAQKVSLDTVQLIEHALSWWDCEASESRRLRHDQINTCPDMRFPLCIWYVPAYYHRNTKRCFVDSPKGTILWRIILKNLSPWKKNLKLKTLMKPLWLNSMMDSKNAFSARSRCSHIMTFRSFFI